MGHRSICQPDHDHQPSSARHRHCNSAVSCWARSHTHTWKKVERRKTGVPVSCVVRRSVALQSTVFVVVAKHKVSAALRMVRPPLPSARGKFDRKSGLASPVFREHFGHHRVRNTHTRTRAYTADTHTAFGRNYTIRTHTCAHRHSRAVQCSTLLLLLLLFAGCCCCAR